MSDTTKIIEVLQNEANRFARTGAKRNARIIRNAIALIRTLPKQPDRAVNPPSDFDRTTLLPESSEPGSNA